MKEINLYEFQSQSVEALRENIRTQIRNQILSAATGSGKTLCAAYLLRECLAKGKRAIFIADRISLIDQTSAVLDEYGIAHGVMQAQHWRCRPWEKIQVASAQTLEKRDWPEADLLVIDEAHCQRKQVSDRIMKRDCIVLGLTATPLTRGLGKYYDAVVTVKTTNELIAEKFLASFRVFCASKPDMTGAKVVAGEWLDSEASKRSMAILGDAVAEYLKHGDGKKFLGFCVDVAECEEMQRHFLSAGIQCSLYTYRTGDEERAQMMAEFRKPDSYIRGLISVAALTKGVDIPDVEVLVYARPLRSSLAEHIQIIGRGLRRDPNNPEKICTILDHSGNWDHFEAETLDFFQNGAPPLDDGKRKPKKKPVTKEKRWLKCPKCHARHPASPSCPNCGHIYPRKSTVEKLAGELQERPLIVSTATTDVKQAWYSQLLHIARARGYKDGWCSHKYKAKFGVWPVRMADDPIPPTQAVSNWVLSEQIKWAKSKRAA